jgi:hypothetical protein
MPEKFDFITNLRDWDRQVDSWNKALYPNKPVDKWQMSDSERMALAGLLWRMRPSTYLEIGTYYGGSALLAAEFAGRVITVDIDPEAKGRFVAPPNVEFVAGSSQQVVPQILDRLMSDFEYPELVLIDGDHSTEGVSRDIEMFLSRRPPKPMLLVFHDAFNPACRLGVSNARWSDSAWAHALDLDFVPGRVVEGVNNPFAGEMWGGLAVALLSPRARSGEFLFKATSAETFRRQSERVTV